MVSMYVTILMYITSRLYIVCVQMVYTKLGCICLDLIGSHIGALLPLNMATVLHHCSMDTTYISMIHNYVHTM